MDLNSVSLNRIVGTDNWAENTVPTDVLQYFGNVGGQIRDVRQSKHMSQESFAQKAGISKVQLSRIENNKHKPSRQTLKKISPLIGISYHDLALQAGYSIPPDDGIANEKANDAMDALSIVSPIYRSDSELLEELRNFEAIGSRENTNTLKSILRGMRKGVVIEQKKADEVTDAERAFQTSFSALRDFINASLSTIDEQP